jgi:hypothetical protein
MIFPWKIVLIFLLALSLRLLFNFFFLEHQVANFADAFYFLTTGNKLFACLLGLDKTCSFFQLFNNHATAASVQTMVSTSLTERLLVDGPIFPFYLGFVQWVSGIDLLSPTYHIHSHIFAIANSIIDSFTCVLIYLIGRFAFTKKASYLASILFAIYPPAIINTSICYSEQFAYFILCLWLYLLLRWRLSLRHPQIMPFTFMLSIATGITSGLTMLVKPVFVLLPPIIFLIILVNLLLKKKRVSFKYIFVTLIAFIFIIFSWSLFTKSATGKYSLFVNRVPSFNFFIGNNIETDGWRAYPLGYIPTTMDEAIKTINAQFNIKPSASISLEIRKIPRLWAGVWNTFSYSFGLKQRGQEIYHQALLFLGYLGFMSFWFSTPMKAPSTSNKKIAALVLITIVVFHSVYLIFEPLSRYAITAMPIIVLFAAYMIVNVINKTTTLFSLATFCLVMVTTLATMHLSYQNFLPCFTLITDNYSWITMAIIVIIFTTWTIIAIALSKSTRISKWALSISAFIAICISTISILDQQNRFEWKCNLNSENQIAQQEIFLPADKKGAALVLFDLSSSEITPDIKVKINNHVINAIPIPLWQFSKSEELVDALSIQAQAMGTSIQKFRQWWAVEIPINVLQFDAINKIAISKNAKETNIINIFGDYAFAYNETNKLTPSFWEASWTKGFNTIERGDCRLYKELSTKSNTANSTYYNGKLWKTDDLSNVLGKQSGQYRIHIALFNPVHESTVNKMNSRLIIERSKEKEILGNNPETMLVTKEALPIPAPENISHKERFIFSEEIKSVNGHGTSYTSINFYGFQGKEKVEWTSNWQPTCIHTNANWQKVYFCDFIPESILKLKDLRCTVMTVPFHADLLFLQRKKALKQKALIRNLKLEIVPSTVNNSFDLTSCSIY